MFRTNPWKRKRHWTAVLVREHSTIQDYWQSVHPPLLQVLSGVSIQRRETSFATIAKDGTIPQALLSANRPFRSSGIHYHKGMIALPPIECFWNNVGVDQLTVGIAEFAQSILGHLSSPIAALMGRLNQPALLHRRRNERREQRMRVEGAGFELGVELHADEPGVVGQLDDLGQQPVG